MCNNDISTSLFLFVCLNRPKALDPVYLIVMHPADDLVE